MIIVFGGFPGTGKTTISKQIAQHFSAVYLRIDSIEQSLKNIQNITDLPIGSEGYFIANSIALDNCFLGNNIVIDCVNPLPITRQVWQETANKTHQQLITIELICSDRQQHRQRIIKRKSDIFGLTQPNWNDIINRNYVPWDHANITIDTSFYTIEQSTKKILSYIRNENNPPLI
ncbi:AAA family ATPase [Commensalibacter oyaizuii]|uniref:AAA family ATPase n=1 Tax=Commensalibacter oyaizuii TaxID=3043873 RepID=A0ABT6PZ68_9PROT|nr:AAA family ATPase [Commensalibacter sp. TBRC 16381]MDI2090147.1 AAA family ATPase [Commensalibacter sp. TBRC 16381]